MKNDRPRRAVAADACLADWQEEQKIAEMKSAAGLLRPNGGNIDWRSGYRQLREFLQLLCSWNQEINLVSEANPDKIWQRHVLQSLWLLPWMQTQWDAVEDIGSGGGFPGLVQAIFRRGKVVLWEQRLRKAVFLVNACHQLRLGHIKVANECWPPADASHADTGKSMLLMTRAWGDWQSLERGWRQCGAYKKALIYIGRNQNRKPLMASNHCWRAKYFAAAPPAASGGIVEISRP